MTMMLQSTPRKRKGARAPKEPKQQVLQPTLQKRRDGAQTPKEPGRPTMKNNTTKKILPQSTLHCHPDEMRRKRLGTTPMREHARALTGPGREEPPLRLQQPLY